MASSFQQYLHSFNVDRRFAYTLFVDALLVVLVVTLFLMLGNVLESRASAISGGKSPEELKTALLTGSIENSQAFLSNVKLFALVMVGSFIIIFLAVLFLTSLSRSLVWRRMLDQPFSFKRYWRWNLITLLLGCMAVIFVLLYVLVRILGNVLLPLSNDTTYALVVQFLNGIFLISFLFIAGSIYYSFAQRYKVLESVAHGFSLLKVHWSNIWKAFLLVLLTGIILSFITYYFQKTFLLYQPPWLNAIISVVVLLLFISWLRLYLFSILHGSPSFHPERPAHLKSNP